jgi:lytic murein transglycosylase
MRLPSLSFALALLASAGAAPTAMAAACNTGNFGAWLQDVRQEAAAKGISPRGISALDGVTYDPNVISHDRGQRVFRQSFAQFSGRMVPPRLHRGANLLRRYADLFSRIEQRFGVPGPVLVAIWGLETDFGAGNGNFATIRSLATLAYDCRRTDKFRAELFDALRIVDRGDMSARAMHGAWAGEIGQTQFMPSSYLKYAVDFGGHRDLIHSVPDVLASTANYLKGYGWVRGAGWEPGQPNFAVIKQWNAADVYARTIANFATRLSAMIR